MSKIEDLIKQYCPNGCEWKTVGECVRILDGQRKPITKAARIAGKYPYYGANGVQDYVADYIFDGTYVLIGEDGSVVTPEGCPIVHWVEGKIWVNNHAHVVGEMPGVSLRYFFYAISNCNVSNLIHGNIPKLNQSDFKAIMIPVPHIAVQDEIVRILDKFTELEKELEKELELRRKQYEWYRDELLTFGDDVERKRLGDVTNVCRGKRVVKRELSDSVGHPVYQNSLSILGYYMDSNYPANTSFVIGAGAAGEIGYSLTDFWAADDCFPIICKGTLLDRFVFYFLMQNQAVLKSKVRKASIPRLSRDKIENLEIPVPSPTEQERIVKILDKFDTLTTSLTSGIPAEIKLRKQQYEYYRDYLFGLLKCQFNMVNHHASV